MQSCHMASGGRPRGPLTRSRSMGCPPEIPDVLLPSDIRVADPTRSASVDKKPNDQDDHLSRGRARRKAFRRQRSLADLFGNVITKGLAHLHELFSTTDRSRDRTSPEGKRGVPTHDVLGASSSSAVRHEAKEGTTEKEWLDEIKVKLSAVRTDSLRSGRHSQTATPREPLDKMSSESISRRNAGRLESYGTPEELFCVTRQTNKLTNQFGCTSVVEQIRTCEVKRYSQRSKSDGTSNGVCCATPPKPAGDRHAMKTLMKCNSDSQCHVTFPRRGLLTKTASVDCYKAASSALVPTDSNSVSLATCSSRSCSFQPQRNIPAALSCFSSILDWLLLGSVEAGHNEPLLCSLAVDAIIDVTNTDPLQGVPAEKKVTCPCTCGRKHFRSKLNLAVDDIAWDDIEQHFCDVNSILPGWRRRSGESRVLVVSYHGRSRGPNMVVQYLMHLYRLPLDTALAHVRSRRPQTRINPSFMRALRRLEARLMHDGRANQAEEPLPFPALTGVSEDVPLSELKTAWNECSNDSHRATRWSLLRNWHVLQNMFQPLFLLCAGGLLRKGF